MTTGSLSTKLKAALLQQAPGRSIDDCIAIARARDSRATLDEDFAADLEEMIANRKPLDTSAWE